MLSKYLFVFVPFTLISLAVGTPAAPAEQYEGMNDMGEEPFIKVQRRDVIKKIFSEEFLNEIRDQAGDNIDKFDNERIVTHVIIALEALGTGTDDKPESKFAIIEWVGDGPATVEPYTLDNASVSYPVLWQTAEESGAEFGKGASVSFDQLDETACVISGPRTKASGCWKHGGLQWCYR